MRTDAPYVSSSSGAADNGPKHSARIARAGPPTIRASPAPMPEDTPLTHRVTIQAASDRSRAVCECSWTSPWATAGPPQPDVPPRTDHEARVIRAAQWHVRNPEVGR
jgi:hypothetical protein